MTSAASFGCEFQFDKREREKAMRAPLFSFKHYLNLRDGNEQAQGLFKAALLFYDEIIVFGPSNWTDSVAEVVCQGSSVRPNEIRSVLRDLEETAFEDAVSPTFALACLESWAGREELGLEPAKLTALIDKVRRRPMDIYTSPLFPLFSSLRFGLPYHSDRRELEEIVDFFDGVQLPRVSVSRELEILLPPVENLPFDAIMELRESPFLPQFRSFLLEGQTAHPRHEELKQSVEHALWDVVGKTKPSRNGSVWARVLASAPVPVPLPLPNPYGVYKEWQSGKKEREMFNTYGWIWFVQEVRERSGSGQ